MMLVFSWLGKILILSNVNGLGGTYNPGADHLSPKDRNNKAVVENE